MIFPVGRLGKAAMYFLHIIECKEKKKYYTPVLGLSVTLLE